MANKVLIGFATGLVLLGLLFVVLILRRTQIAEWTIHRILASYDISAKLNVAELSLSHVLLENIEIQQKTNIPILRVDWKIESPQSLNVKNIEFEIAALDVTSTQQLINKVSQPQSSEDSDDIITTITNACELLTPIHISGHIKKVITTNDNLSFEFSTLHLAGSDIFKISAGGEQFNGEGELNCRAINMEATDSFARINKLNLILPTDVYSHPQIQIEYIELSSEHVDAHFKQPNHLVVNADFESTLKGKHKDNEINVKALVQSQVDVLPDKITAIINLEDKTRTLVIKDANINYYPSFSRLEWDIPPYKSQIKLSSKISSIYPHYKTFPFQPTGIIQFGTSGTYSLNEENSLSGARAKLRGKDINLISESINFEGLSFQHEISSFDSFSSPPGQTIKVKRIDIADGIRNLHINYQTKKLDELAVRQLNLQYGTAEFKLLQPFRFDPLNYNVDGLKARVSHLELEKLLSLALQDQIKAQGLLTGVIEFSLLNKKPQVHGFLSVNEPGWIQYRPGPKPENHLNLSDGPMEILKAYLYDFHYEDLSVDIRSNEFYKMTMAFKSLGRNPEYLQGKPLKLNVNIEQNLLAALQTLMLTYDLPERLKQHFEKEVP